MASDDDDVVCVSEREPLIRNATEPNKRPRLGEYARDSAADGTALDAGCTITASGEFALECFQCPICIDLLHQPCVVPCGHEFCLSCIQEVVACARHRGCPVCRSQFTAASLGVNHKLRAVIERLFPKDTARRAREVAEDEELRHKQRATREAQQAAHAAAAPRAGSASAERRHATYSRLTRILEGMQALREGHNTEGLQSLAFRDGVAQPPTRAASLAAARNVAAHSNRARPGLAMPPALGGMVDASSQLPAALRATQQALDRVSWSLQRQMQRQHRLTPHTPRVAPQHSAHRAAHEGGSSATMQGHQLASGAAPASRASAYAAAYPTLGHQPAAAFPVSPSHDELMQMLGQAPAATAPAAASLSPFAAASAYPRAVPSTSASADAGSAMAASTSGRTFHSGTRRGLRQPSRLPDSAETLPADLLRRALPVVHEPVAGGPNAEPPPARTQAEFAPGWPDVVVGLGHSLTSGRTASAAYRADNSVGCGQTQQAGNSSMTSGPASDHVQASGGLRLLHADLLEAELRQLATPPGSISSAGRQRRPAQAVYNDNAWEEWLQQGAGQAGVSSDLSHPVSGGRYQQEPDVPSDGALDAERNYGTRFSNSDLFADRGDEDAAEEAADAEWRHANDPGQTDYGASASMTSPFQSGFPAPLQAPGHEVLGAVSLSLPHAVAGMQRPTSWPASHVRGTALHPGLGQAPAAAPSSLTPWPPPQQQRQGQEHGQPASVSEQHVPWHEPLMRVLSAGPDMHVQPRRPDVQLSTQDRQQQQQGLGPDRLVAWLEQQAHDYGSYLDDGLEGYGFRHTQGLGQESDDDVI